MELRIGNRLIADSSPCYFIADISANHDGSLERAVELIALASEAGADAAKFQNFRAEHIVSDLGFRNLGRSLAHQRHWKKSVYEIYEDASIPFEWTPILKEECARKSIEYLSTPYDFEALEMLDPYVKAFKIGSGDITWSEFLRRVAGTGKPVILSTGASSFAEVKTAVEEIRAINPKLVLLQCNTNYAGSAENISNVNLKVLESYREAFPSVILGLSDHTPGDTTVLGAISLGARVVEKHFTDDPRRIGPDHAFSMTPEGWASMLSRARELEKALGSSIKRVESNESETVIVQRRCLRAARHIGAGETISRGMVSVLRPATLGALMPNEIDSVIGSKARVNIAAGRELFADDLTA